MVLEVRAATCCFLVPTVDADFVTEELETFGPLEDVGVLGVLPAEALDREDVGVLEGDSLLEAAAFRPVAEGELLAVLAEPLEKARMYMRESDYDGVTTVLLHNIIKLAKVVKRDISNKKSLQTVLVLFPTDLYFSETLHSTTSNEKKPVAPIYIFNFIQSLPSSFDLITCMICCAK